MKNASYYTILPVNELRDPQKVLPAFRLDEMGRNFASVLHRMQTDHPEAFDKLKRGLRVTVPDIIDIEIDSAGSYLVVNLVHEHQVAALDLSQESDGTLRILGILTALYQVPPPSLITLEEPELYIHPGALFALYEMFKEASLQSQLLITTHSPDLMSHCKPEQLRVVDKVDGATTAAPLDERQIEIVNEKLFVTGDLLRIEGLQRQS